MSLVRSGWGFCFAGRSFLPCGLGGGLFCCGWVWRAGCGGHKCLLCAEVALGGDSWEGKRERADDQGDRGGLGFWFLCGEPPGQGRECFVFLGRLGLVVRMDVITAGWVFAPE